jgi:hypothetical protein
MLNQQLPAHPCRTARPSTVQQHGDKRNNDDGFGPATWVVLLFVRPVERRRAG